MLIIKFVFLSTTLTLTTAALFILPYLFAIAIGGI